MPYDEPDPQDPSMLVGVGLPCGEEEVEEMAASFASELAQIGHGEEHILRIFGNAFYAGAHMAWVQLGEMKIRDLVSEAVEFWSHCRVSVKDKSTEDRLVPVDSLRSTAHCANSVSGRRR